jgi:transposase, IS5 family
MPGFFDVDERLADLSAKGDDLEWVKALVDFEIFRPALEAAVPRADRSKGGRPPFDHGFMFKALILQAMDSLSDERCEFLIKYHLSFMRFLGLGLSDAVPDANTIWTFRETLKKANAVDALFQRFDAALRDAGSLAMSGQIVDARSSPRPSSAIRTTRKAIKEGRVPEDRKEKPAKLAQKDRDARWTIKYTTAKPKEDGAPQVDVAVPAFGYKNHVSIDRAYGLIRKWTATQHRVFGAGAIHWPHEFEYRSSLFKMPSAISFSI